VTAVSRASANGLPRARNGRATASAVVGAAAVVVVPLTIAASRYFTQVTLVRSCASAIVAAGLGLSAILLARRGRETIQRTLGRSGGGVATRAGRALGVVALWIAGTTALALAFYALLTLFAD
jgi:hypothetical protein